MKKIADLIRRAFAAMADPGGKYTDARESAGEVAAVQNPADFARKSAPEDTVVATGHLKADGQAVCSAQVRITGALVVKLPEGFDTSGRTWTIVLANGACLRVAMASSEYADDKSWIIDDAETFWAEII